LKILANNDRQRQKLGSESCANHIAFFWNDLVQGNVVANREVIGANRHLAFKVVWKLIIHGQLVSKQS
jgi:hypothetical protein